MRAENSEQHTNSLSDDLPVCNFTGTGTASNQIYKDDGYQRESRQSYDHSFQYQQIEDRTCLYMICSSHKLAAFAKEKLIAEILFGQLDVSSAEGVKDVLRLAFTALEKDYLNLIDESLTEKVQRQYQQEANGHEAPTNEYDETNDKQNNQMNITLALIYNSKLYVCNVGQCRAILCKTDERNVLRAVQLSGAEIGNDTNSGEKVESIASQLEIIGPIPLDDTCRFLVLMSCGLCKTLKELHTCDQHIANRELIQLVVQQFRVQSTLSSVAQAVIDKIASQHHEHFLNLMNEMSSLSGRADLTLVVRNFNFPMPNLVQPPRIRGNVTFNPIDKEHLLTNSTYSSLNQNTIDTTNSLYTNSSDTTSSSDRMEFYDKNIRITPYVDFSDYYQRVEQARLNGTLSTKIQFD